MSREPLVSRHFSQRCFCLTISRHWQFPVLTCHSPVMSFFIGRTERTRAPSSERRPSTPSDTTVNTLAREQSGQGHLEKRFTRHGPQCRMLGAYILTFHECVFSNHSSLHIISHALHYASNLPRLSVYLPWHALIRAPMSPPKMHAS